MGRPLAKRFFGNRNIGTNGGYTADDGIGGEGLASAAVSVAGSYTATLPTLTFSAPQLPGGVTSTGVIVSKVISATISGGTGYGNAQTFDLTVTTAGGSAVLNVTSDAGGAVVTVNSVTTAGSFTALSAVTGVSGGTGTGAVPVLTYGALSVTVTNKGSGYTAAPTVSYTNRGGITVNTITLTTDSGDVGSVTNQENAILAYAYVTGNSLVADIQAQKGSRRYRVATSEGTAVCSLVAATPAAVGEMSITATDSSGKTYYVTKLTRHKALLTQYGTAGHEFATGDTVEWTFDAATLNTTVQIANA
jgi:hypothetical protein